MTNRRHAAIAQDPVNVKYYGAKGDGLTDDSAAILDAVHAAFGYLPYNEGYGLPPIHLNRQLYFPEGRYIITNPITINHTSSARIHGAGKHATVIENVSTDNARNKSPWIENNDTYYPMRSIFSTDGFGYSLVENMSLISNGGIGFNCTWARVAGGGSIPADTVSTQQCQFRNLYFKGCALGICMGDDCIYPRGGMRAVFTTASLTNGSRIITNIASGTAGLLPNWFVQVEREPFVVGGDLLSNQNALIEGVLSGNSIQMPTWAVANTTMDNVPIRFGRYGEMSDGTMIQNCDFTDCAVSGVSSNNYNSLTINVVSGRFENCGIAIHNRVGSIPRIVGCEFVNSTDFDIKVINIAAADAFSIKGCRSNSRNFGLFHGFGNVAFSGCRHAGPAGGVFAFIEGGTMCADACSSTNGKMTGHGKISARGSTWGNPNFLTEFIPEATVENI